MPDRSMPGALVDFGFRSAYRVAHRMLRAWWSVRHPRTRGALVAVWNQGEVLLVKNSYRREYTLPGGYIRRGESPTQAAMRELAEEVGISVPATDLAEAYKGTFPYEHRDDDVTIVELIVEQRPEYAVDNREVVWAGFMRPTEALAMPVVPHLKDYLRSARDRPDGPLERS